MQWEPAKDTSPPPTLSPPTMVRVDNQGAMKLADNPQFHNRTKYIDIRYQFVRDTLAAGKITLQYLPRADMVADFLPSRSLEINTKNILERRDCTPPARRSLPGVQRRKRISL